MKQNKLLLISVSVSMIIKAFLVRYPSEWRSLGKCLVNAQPSQKTERRKTHFSPPPQTKLKSQSSLQTIKSDVTMETAERSSPTGRLGSYRKGVGFKRDAP